MVIVVGIILAAVAMLAVAYPVLMATRQHTSRRSSAVEALDELLAQRDTAFQALRDLSFDRQVGKITDEDYEVFAANLRAAAADALRALDDWEAQADAEVSQALSVQPSTASTGAAGQKAAACPHCGRRSVPGDQFCAGCGKPLARAAVVVAPKEKPAACPQCGRAALPSDTFCAGCGNSLETRGPAVRAAG